LSEGFGVTDGARTHDNWNHNPKPKKRAATKLINESEG
jgi:hypothetical protein